MIFWGAARRRRATTARAAGPACAAALPAFEGESCTPPSPRPSTPFLILPTSCAGQLTTHAVRALAWTGEQSGSSYVFQNQLGASPGRPRRLRPAPLRPRDRHRTRPAGRRRPARRTRQLASTPTGLNVDVKLAQQGTLTEDALAEADVQSATVTLPQGVMLNPGAANGLEACSEQQIGYLGEGGSDPFSPGAAEPLRFTTAEAHCPEASKLGTVRSRPRCWKKN